jgi:hypothetical protein
MAILFIIAGVIAIVITITVAAATIVAIVAVIAAAVAVAFAANAATPAITRGSGPEKCIFFKCPPKSFLSVPIYSIRCEYDILKVLLKKIDQNLPIGCVKH